jgi:hypothetical protein
MGKLDQIPHWVLYVQNPAGNLEYVEYRAQSKNWQYIMGLAEQIKRKNFDLIVGLKRVHRPIQDPAPILATELDAQLLCLPLFSWAYAEPTLFEEIEAVGGGVSIPPLELLF